MRERRRVMVRGIVQGVGFRPFIHGLARRHNLAGHVGNDSGGVTIEAEGDSAELTAFLDAIRNDPPLLALVEEIIWETMPLQGDVEFVIAHSHASAQKQTSVSPDVNICDDCLRELFSAGDRRYRYPFINCTNCGPRFTIIYDVPYDRPSTTMARFLMCPDCRREYDDPGDRRFHAQPNACPRCGPQVSLHAGGARIKGYAAIETTARLLREGKILAVKGLGGYHLACNAANPEAVARLRALKHRWDKPFALMVASVGEARQLCFMDEAERELLASRRRPIVLLREREPGQVAEDVAPRQRDLGIMLPYTPLHYLLLDAYVKTGEGPHILVMTSGNVSDEPIAYRDDDALARLGPLADGFLRHDREIHMRCDDSVARVVAGRQLMLRRSRGYAPEPLRCSVEFRQPILATGAHLKNTFCLAKGHHAFVSHHIGDLENYETYRSFTAGIEHFQRLFDVAPEIVAYDLHPEYLATKYAMELSETCTAIGVQHHHAHIASVMGEHGLAGPVIGVAFDGTGYGTDGAIWGGEFMVADYREFERLAHLETLPLIGGEQAIHQVWRLAAGWLQQVYGDSFLDLDIDFARGLDAAQWQLMRRMLERDFNTPRSSAMGRLFDAVAALLGVRRETHYEGQAAIELEAMADSACNEAYLCEAPASLPGAIGTSELLRAIVDDLRRGLEPSIIAAKFNNTIAAMTVQTCTAIREQRGLNEVVLCGGVFQNARLLQRTLELLKAQEFETYIPNRLPPNDGGISFGQALIANARLGQFDEMEVMALNLAAAEYCHL